MSSSPFQITGVASGIEWDGIIDEMISAASKPKTQWQNQIDTLTYKKTLYQEVASKIYSMRSSMTTLKMPSAYKKKTAEYTVHTSGKNAENIAKATVNANAEIAQWDLDVKQLAASERYVSKQFSPSDSLGIKGDVRIQIGIQVATLKIEESDNLRTINQKINNLTAADGSAVAVSAQLIDNRLVITGALTGRDEEGPLGSVTMSMYDSLEDAAGNKVTYLPRPSTYEDPDSKSGFKQGALPKQIFSLTSDNKTYRYGRDYTYDADKGVITWLKGGNRPADGAQIEAVFGTTLGANGSLNGGTDSAKLDGWDAAAKTGTVNVTAEGAAQLAAHGISTTTATTIDNVKGLDLLPSLEGQSYLGIADSSEPGKYMSKDDMQKRYSMYDASGNKLEYGTDYLLTEVEYTDDNGNKQTRQAVVWLKEPPSKYQLVVGGDNDYYVSNRQVHLIEDNPTSINSVLYQLGITDIHDPSGGDPAYITYNNRSYAKDALFTLNGVEVKRPTNTVPVEDDESDAVIANVKLELTGVGHVTINVTQDAQEIIDNVQKFIDSYNELLELINYRLSESETSSSTAASDTLSEILNSSRGETQVFGLLHGDSLLRSVKSQFRNYFSNSIASLSGDLRTRKYLITTNSLDLTGSLYINAGAKQARIDIERGDSLVDIQRKLNNATAMNGTDGGKTSSGASLGLEVDIVDGQLVIRRGNNYKGSMSENHTITRDGTQQYDQLPFVPTTGGSVKGALKVSNGSTTYVEGRDYEVATTENENGVLESRLVWLQGGSKPDQSKTYSVSYEYQADGLAYTMIPNSGDLSTLNLHFDTGSTQLSTFGISTTSDDFGKSGLIDFDSDKFFNAIVEDSDRVSNVMLSFMESIDKYIGNLVDSSNQVIGGNIVTKGRFQATYNRIDNQISDLQERIKNLERNLEDKQNALYKQYSDMEQSIQIMNAQMSSLVSYLNSAGSGGGGGGGSQ